LDQLLHTTAGPAAARARWTAFRGQLHRHLAAEQAALWRPARAKLAGDPHGQALLEAMDDEHHLIGPLHAAADDAFAMAAGPGRLHPLLTRLRTKLTSHLAHEETDALPLLGQLLSDRELAQLRRALRGPIGRAPGGGAGAGPAARTLPWALAPATPAIPPQALCQLPAPPPPPCRPLSRPPSPRP